MSRLLAAAILILSVFAAMPAASQDLDDIPSPEELGSADATGGPLRIDWPADGDAVKTPFTVSGVAPPGARLELRLGEQLERVFLADANGRFNTPVSRKSTADEIWIHEVDRNGKRVRSVSVAVVWAGDATPLAAPEQTNAAPAVDPPAAASADEPEPTEPVEDIDPFGKKTHTASGLPRVSEIDDVDSLDVAPIPPSPADLTFDEPQAEDAPADVTAPAEAAVVTVPSRRPPPRGARMAAEAGLGLVGAAALGFGTALLGFGLGAATGDGYGALALGALGGLTGWVVGLPIGVVFAGSLMDGNGKWYATVAGEAAGILIGLLFTSSYTGYSEFPPLFTLVTLPLVGAVTGYELTSDHSASQAAAAKRMQTLRPTITPTRDGGFAFGFNLRF